MKTSYLVCNTSDFHLENSAKVVLDYLTSKFLRIDQFALIGDRSVDPDFSETDGKNLLRDAKIKAKKEGREHKEAENEVWASEYQDVLVRQWLGILEPTQRMHSLIEEHVKNEMIPQILDLGGNDCDKEKRVLKAYEFSGEPKEKTLFDILNDSFAFRKLQGIEFKVVGKTLEINIPYIEDKSDEELQGYTSRIEGILEKNGRRISQIVFRSHSNSDPKLREEKRNTWYKPIFDRAKKVNPDAKVMHIFGHCHKIPKPYEFNGVLLVPVGYGKKEGLQRVFVQDYFNPGKDIIKDLKLESPRLELNLRKRVEASYKKIHLVNRDGEDYEIEIVGSDIPDEIREKDCRDIAKQLFDEYGYYAATMYRRDAKGRIVHYDSKVRDISRISEPHECVIDVDPNTNKRIKREPEWPLKYSGMTTPDDDVAEKVLRLFEAKGYEVKADFKRKEQIHRHVKPPFEPPRF
jgi:hypothetical protein